MVGDSSSSWTGAGFAVHDGSVHRCHHRAPRGRRTDGEPRRQAFFWLGDVILELVGRDDLERPGPARFWGLAMSCNDLDAAAALLGRYLDAPKAAVQAGRTIATLQTSELGISVPIALMSPQAADDQ